MATDIDVLLVGPGGQSVILMSDVGGGTPLSNVTLTLDDAASASLPGTAIATGTYQPTNGPADACGEDAFDAPAPTGSYGSTLSVFNGTIPNGTWSLYVVDDCSGDLGEISGGWSLEITVADAEDNEPPVLTVPDDITVSTDPGQPNAIVTFSATATDNSGSATVTCLPASGSSFAIGTTTVNCTATDAAINSDSDSFTVTVTDDEAPVLTVPDDITVPTDSGQADAVVTFSATATDNSGAATVDCTPPSGTSFAIGTTTVNCIATDASENTDSGSFTVTVTDDEVPVLTVPANIAVGTDPGQPHAIVSFSATATDNSGSATVTCLPASGSNFPIGTTTVDCTATDAAINSDSDSFTVTVTDDEAPVLTVPDDITVPARGPGGAIVSFTVTAADNAGPVTATCTPASGSLFAPGETLVTCNVTDIDGNTVSDTFTVTVLGAGDLLTQLRAETIARVDNPFFERSMVLVLNLSSRLNSQGRPELTQLYLRYYDFQLSLGTALRLIPTDDAAQLRMLLAQVRDAMS